MKTLQVKRTKEGETFLEELNPFAQYLSKQNEEQQVNPEWREFAATAPSKVVYLGSDLQDNEVIREEQLMLLSQFWAGTEDGWQTITDEMHSNWLWEFGYKTRRSAYKLKSNSHKSTYRLANNIVMDILQTIDTGVLSDDSTPETVLGKCVQQVFEMLKDRTDPHKALLTACKYGYEYHKNSQFPEASFEEFCLSNYKQFMFDKGLLV